jgi:FixJ family two-component response regulator
MAQHATDGGVKGPEMRANILFVDDEPKILQALERQLRKHFSMETAVGAEQGLRAVSNRGPYAVVVSDLRMPEMDGIQFLARVREISPDSVRVMFTGHADVTAAIAAVNEGNIFRFLTKPCPPESLRNALNAALEQYRLVTAERELLGKTLNGSIRVLTELLSLVNPLAFSRAYRIRRYVRHMAQKLGLADLWEFELAAMLSQIGCISVPPEVLDKVYASEELSPAEQEVLDSHPQLGCDLLAHIPRLETVAQIIAGQQCRPGVAARSDRASMGAQLLRLAIDFDEAAVGSATGKSAVSRLRAYKIGYDPSLLAALESVKFSELDQEERVVNVSDLSADMILNQDVRAKNGVLLMAKGHEVTYPVIVRLRSFARTVGVVQPFSVLAQHRNPLESVPRSTEGPRG